MTSTSAVPTSAPVSCSIDFSAAALGLSPSSLMRRSTFSTTTDGENHPEHGQGVDRIPEPEQHGEGGQDDDRHRDGGDERRPPVLQEEVQDEDDEDDRLRQRLRHFPDGDGDEGRGVVGIDAVEAGGEEASRLVDVGLDRVRRVQRVRAGGEADRHPGGGV